MTNWWAKLSVIWTCKYKVRSFLLALKMKTTPTNIQEYLVFWYLWVLPISTVRCCLLFCQQVSATDWITQAILCPWKSFSFLPPLVAIKKTRVWVSTATFHMPLNQGPARNAAFWLSILISRALAQQRKGEDRYVGAKILPNCSSLCQSSEWELLYALSTLFAIHNTDDFRGISNNMDRQWLWSNCLHSSTKLNFHY